MTQREKIISQAADMFVELGIKSIRMDDIAGALSISKRTLYEMFADKEELLYLCIMHLRERDWEEIERRTAAVADNPIDALFESFRIMLEISEHRRRMSTNLQKFYPQLHARVAEASMRNALERLRNTIRHYIDEGLFSSNINIDLSITIFYYTASNIFGRANVVLPEGVTEKEVFMYTMVHFFRGLATARGMELIDEYIEKHGKSEK